MSLLLPPTLINGQICTFFHFSRSFAHSDDFIDVTRFAIVSLSCSLGSFLLLSLLFRCNWADRELCFGFECVWMISNRKIQRATCLFRYFVVHLWAMANGSKSNNEEMVFLSVLIQKKINVCCFTWNTVLVEHKLKSIMSVWSSSQFHGNAKCEWSEWRKQNRNEIWVNGVPCWNRFTGRLSG